MFVKKRLYLNHLFQGKIELEQGFYLKSPLGMFQRTNY